MPTPTTPNRTPTRTTPDGRALARAVAPVTAEQFLAEHWEQKPLVVERDEAGRFDDLLSEADVERLVCSPGLRHPGFRLVKAEEQLAPSSYTKSISWRPTPFTGAADVPAVLAEWERGATIVLQALHHTWPPLVEFCRSLEHSLGHPAQANAYYTPRGSQGLAVHHDTHDVLVLQVSGHKRWLVYEPVWELPLKHQRYRRELGEPGETVLEVVLRAGDTLYLPRGWLHEALTSEADSLHLTIGVSVYAWADAVAAALAECEHELEFRRAVPADGVAQADLLELLETRLDADSVTRRMRDRLLDTRRPALAGQLSQLRALDSLDLDTQLERRPTVIADLAGTTLRFEGKRVSFPEQVRDELEFATTATAPFALRELPGRLDERGRLVLARRLVREGFLRIVVS